MKNSSTKFFLLFSILLTIGCSQSSILAHHCYSSIKIPERLAFAGIAIKKNDYRFIFEPVSTGAGKKNSNIDLAEIEREENELSSSKKSFEPGIYFIILFDTDISTYFSDHISKSLFLFRKFSYITTRGSHLTFQVFRI